VSITLSNAGVGPAIISKCSYVIDGIRFAIARIEFPEAIRQPFTRPNTNMDFYTSTSTY